ncbi:MAG TPA: hypothetical protein VKR60_02390 [Candidatus Sulfotelmatobacter sp.]|nr:hypothetical protein [Candidatus Sulfotelmatobacter sp.]
MKTIPISAKGFAEFVLAGPSRKATIVRNILKPKSKEAQVIVLYYARAIRIIRLYHTKGNDGGYLKHEIHGLEKKLEAATTNQARAGLRNNLRAIRSYMDIYGNRKRKIVPRPRIYYTHGRVRLSASPDLAVEEDGRLKLVKLGITKEGDNPELVRIMLRVIYQAANAEYEVQPHDVVYFDVTNAVRRRSSTEDSDLATTIDNGCDTLAGMV